MKVLMFSLIAILLCGCLAIVDVSSGAKKVKSFIITKQEILDILSQAEEKTPEQVHQIFPFKKKQTE